MSDNANKMRDRLIELIGSKVCEGYSPTCDEYDPHTCSNCYANDCKIGNLADYLLANGVVVPTFNIGDKVWFIPKGLKEVCEATVVRIEYNYFTNPQEWLEIEYFSSIVEKQKYKSRIDLMLNKTIFRTKEEAERALKGGASE